MNIDRDFAPRIRPSNRPAPPQPRRLLVMSWPADTNCAPRLRPAAPPLVALKKKKPRRLSPFGKLEHKDFAPRLRPASQEPVLDANWWSRAACLGMDTNIWFPGPGGSQRQAKQICSGCPVRRECKNDADANLTEWGIWGGEIRHRIPARERRVAA